MIEVTEDEKRLGQNHVEIIAEDVDIVYQFPHPMKITFLMLKEAKHPEEYETVESMLENIISAEMEI